MGREHYSPEILAQASLDVAKDPELGNASLAQRVEEIIEEGGDPFDFVFHALGTGVETMRRAEEIRLEQARDGNGHHYTPSR